MFRNTHDFEKAMCIVLEVFNSDHPSFNDPKLTSNYDKLEIGDAIATCINAGYIEGLTADKNALGTYIINTVGNPRVTLSGLKFMEKHK